MSGREGLTDDQRQDIIANSIDLGQMLDAAFALGREAHDAKIAADTAERIAVAIEARRDHNMPRGPKDRFEHGAMAGFDLAIDTARADSISEQTEGDQ